MGREDDPVPGIAQLPNLPQNLRLIRHIEGARRLVQNDERGVLHQGSGNTHLLTLTAGQLIQRGVRQVEQPQFLHHGVHLLTVTARGRREQPNIGCATHQQVLGHGVGDAATLHLRKVRDAAGTLRRGQRIQRLTAQVDGALGERVQTN